jgi:exodeoxyribonuclease V alpha subunit
MLSRALLYTAVTRAQQLCVLVGERKAVAVAVGRVEQRRRHSALAERIVG